MKTRLLIFLLSLSFINGKASDYLKVYKNGAIVVTVLLTDIDSLSFPSGVSIQDEKMRIHKSDNNVIDILVHEIDSIKINPEYIISEREALIAIYNSMGGDNWKDKTNWCSDKPLREWLGVGTDYLGRVTSIYMYYNNTSGSIPMEIGSLPYLESLNICDNNLLLTGTIPEEIGKLSRLKYLRLNTYSMIGDIPESLYNLKGLTDLTICENISGKISPKIGNLTNLTTLDLSGPAGLNNAFSGELPKEIFNLINLTNFTMQGSNLSGSLPHEIGNLKKLKTLWIVFCPNLTGNLPDEIGELPDLETIYIQNTGLSGSIPESITKLTKLKEFTIAHTDISGLPLNLDQLWTNSNLQNFDICKNKLTGKLPVSFTSHPRWGEFAHSVLIQQDGYGYDREGVTISLPKFAIADINNKPIVSDSIIPKKKLTLINFWNTTCPFSKILAPAFNKQYSKYKDAGLEIISMSRAETTGIDGIRNYIAVNNIPWYNAVEDRWGIPNGFELKGTQVGSLMTGVPEVFAIDNNYKIVYDPLLGNSWDKLEEFVDNYFGYSQVLYTSSDYSKDGEVVKLQSATKGLGVNIVILGDAFVDTTMVENGIYEIWMKRAMESFFSIEPTKSYRDYFNVYCVKAVSKNGDFKNNSETRFSTAFGAGTFVYGNNDKIAEYVQKIPGINQSKTQIIAVINSPRYAGTCFMYDDASIAFVPTVANDEKEFSDIIHHEAIGHGLGKLLDEYIYFDKTIDQAHINDLLAMQSKGYGMNLSISENNLPWKHFIGLAGYSDVSAFEGGYFFTKGVWRSEKNSCMNNNVPYFSAPGREEIVKRLLNIAGEEYSLDKFIVNDKLGLNLKSMFLPKHKEPLAPPVLKDRNLF